MNGSRPDNGSNGKPDFPGMNGGSQNGKPDFTADGTNTWNPNDWADKDWTKNGDKTGKPDFGDKTGMNDDKSGKPDFGDKTGKNPADWTNKDSGKPNFPGMNANPDTSGKPDFPGMNGGSNNGKPDVTADGTNTWNPNDWNNKDWIKNGDKTGMTGDKSGKPDFGDKTGLNGDKTGKT